MTSLLDDPATRKRYDLRELGYRPPKDRRGNSPKQPDIAAIDAQLRDTLHRLDVKLAGGPVAYIEQQIGKIREKLARI